MVRYITKLKYKKTLTFWTHKNNNMHENKIGILLGKIWLGFNRETDYLKKYQIKIIQVVREKFATFDDYWNSWGLQWTNRTFKEIYFKTKKQGLLRIMKQKYFFITRIFLKKAKVVKKIKFPTLLLIMNIEIYRDHNKKTYLKRFI